MLETVMWGIAGDACRRAVGSASTQLNTLSGGDGTFFPRVNMDKYTVGIGLNPRYHYLVYQENGFASFPMKWAYGRVVKMVVDGEVIFRKCTNINQFRSGSRVYWGRDSGGNLISHTAQKRSWVHPGLGPKNFMHDSLKQTIKDWQSTIDKAIVIDALAGENHGK